MKRENGISISELLKMNFMRNSKILVSEKGINRIISNVNIMADQDIMNWVRSNELLLTTAGSLKKLEEKEQEDFIREAKKGGLVALGIKRKTEQEQIPEKIIKVSEEIDFMIIDIDQRASLSDIMVLIVNEIFDRKTYLLNRIENIYEQFIGAILDRGNIEDIANLISENISNPIIIELELSNSSIDTLDNIEVELKKGLIENAEKYFSNSKNRNSKKIEESVEMINEGYVDRVIIPIVIKDIVYGHIISWSIKASLGGYEISVLEIASKTLALEILKDISIREVENKYKSEIIEDLISTDVKRKQKAIERIFVYFIEKSECYIAVTLKIEFEGKDKMDVSHMQKYVSKYYNFIEKQLESYKIQGVIGSKIEEIILILSYNNTEERKEVLNFAKEIENRIIREKDENIKIGIGRPYEKIEDFHKSYSDSIKAIGVGKILMNEITTDFEKVGIYKILCQDNLKDELVNFYNITIKSLVEYDEKKSTELVRTLEAYYENNGNLRKMSDKLFTHYNTILYRVQRIEEITNMRLDNPKHRLNLEIALKIKKFLKNDK